MTTIAQVDVRAARQRAGKIREGIHNYLETLALIGQAWQARDWQTLGYDDWDQYVETEFSEARLRLPAEHRQKAVTELRLAGMSQRAIGSALGIPQTQVSRDLATDSGESVAGSDLPATTTGLDGRQRAATQPPRRTKKDSPAEPVPDQPVPMPAEGPPLSLDDGGSRVPPPDEAEDVAASDAGGSPGSATQPTADPGTQAQRSDPRAVVKDAMDRHLPPDPDEPYQDWRDAYLDKLGAARKPTLVREEEFLERADEQCFSELRLFAQDVAAYFARVEAAWLGRYGGNVTPLRKRGA